MKCPHCNKTFNLKFKFCPYCGKILIEVPEWEKKLNLEKNKKKIEAMKREEEWKRWVEKNRKKKRPKKRTSPKVYKYPSDADTGNERDEHYRDEPYGDDPLIDIESEVLGEYNYYREY